MLNPITNEKLKHYFPKASKSFLIANTSVSSPVFEPPVWNGALAKTKRKDQGIPLPHIRITSYRARLLDYDNLCSKFLIDAIRAAGIIKDDSPAHITSETNQVKVEHKNQEKTLVEIWLPNLN